MMQVLPRPGSEQRADGENSAQSLEHAIARACDICDSQAFGHCIALDRGALGDTL